MRVHCPRCGKHYLVDPSLSLDQGMDRVQVQYFICRACQHEFAVKPESALMTEIMAASADAPSERECPYCQGSIDPQALECPHCLKVPGKFKDSSRETSSQAPQNSPNPLQQRVKEEWQQMLDNFADPDAHQRFITLCDQLGDLDIAHERYLRLREIIGEDREIDKRLQQIELLRLERGASRAPVDKNFPQTPSINRAGLGSPTAKALVTRQWGWLLVTLGAVGVSGLWGTRAFFSTIGIFILIGILLNGIKK